jgi:hypothetical protein
MADKTRSTIQCPLCAWSKKKGFENHLIQDHNKTSKTLWDELNSGPRLCRCGCNEETKFINWKLGYSDFLKGHNANIYSSYDKETAEKIALTRGSNWRGKVGWSRGKTKDNDERVKNRALQTSAGRKKAIDEGKISIWSTGKTKNDDARIANAAQKISSNYKSGKVVPWAQGLKKETSQKVSDMADRVSMTLRKKEIREKLDSLKRLSKEEIKLRIEKTGNLQLSDDLAHYTNDLVSHIAVTCNHCGLSFKNNLRVLQFGRCVGCNPTGSAAEQEINYFIKSLGISTKQHVRDIIPPKEIDIWIDDQKIGVEYHGLYWHSEINKSSKYHSDKLTAASKAGIRLIQIFEDDWREKTDIVKSILRNSLGRTLYKIDARKCSLIELTSPQQREFFEKNHLDGGTPSIKAWGLIFNQEIVAAISLRKPFHKKYDNHLEISRSCSKLNHSIRGGLSRLVRQAHKFAKNSNIEGLLTYVDTRFGTGVSYEKAGFKLIGKTPNRFWWTDMSNRFNRFKFRADKKEGLTETEVAQQHGVVKIWGCPNLIYEMKL